MVPPLTAERGWLGVGGLVVLLLLESLQPFQKPIDSRWRRYLINLLIAGSNALLLSVLLGGFIVAAYQSFALHRMGLPEYQRSSDVTLGKMLALLFGPQG